MNNHRCSNCHTENRAEARFCKRCGFWLLPNCPFCNTILPEVAFFCDHCGRQVSTQVSSPILSPSFQPADDPTTHSPQALPKILKNSVSELALTKSELHQYIPKELMKKLQDAQD